MNTNLARTIVASALVSAFFSGAAFADEAPIFPVLADVSSSRTTASVEVRNGGDAPFRVAVRIEFVDAVSHQVLAVVKFPTATVGSEPGARVQLKAEMPSRDVLPEIAYFTRTLAEAEPLSQSLPVAVLP